MTNNPGAIGECLNARLKGVLGVVGLLERRPAYAENHWSVPDHQLFEGRLGTIILLGDKPVQKLRIGNRSHSSELVYAIDLSKHLVPMNSSPSCHPSVNAVSIFKCPLGGKLAHKKLHGDFRVAMRISGKTGRGRLIAGTFGGVPDDSRNSGI